MQNASFPTFKTLATLVPLLLVSSCGERPVAIAPDTAVPCEALRYVVVRPSSVVSVLSDGTALDINTNNRAIRSACPTLAPAAR